MRISVPTVANPPKGANRIPVINCSRSCRTLFDASCTKLHNQDTGGTSWLANPSTVVLFLQSSTSISGSPATAAATSSGLRRSSSTAGRAANRVSRTSSVASRTFSHITLRASCSQYSSTSANSTRSSCDRDGVTADSTRRILARGRPSVCATIASRLIVVQCRSSPSNARCSIVLMRVQLWNKAGSSHCRSSNDTGLSNRPLQHAGVNEMPSGASECVRDSAISLPMNRK
mmetsp:Transcript_17478/g.37934  ORF Transcript_17478/g.37934 Transcript_17478/m.37934 type:complete len:231 (-) Transcript_17478:520-1212(-)